MRAQNSGISLTESDAAIVKAMLERGDRQHDIAAWYGVNGGRIGEISTGEKFCHVHSADQANLPPPGPYPNGRDAMIALDALVAAQRALASAEAVVRNYARVRGHPIGMSPTQTSPEFRGHCVIELATLQLSTESQ